MNFKKLLCMSLAILSIFASAVSVGAQEEPEAAGEAVLEEDAELMAITEVKYNGMMFECDTKAKTAVAITFLDTHTAATIPATVTSGSTACKVIGISDSFASGSEKIVKVSLENATNLVTIGENAFSYCPNLTTVIFKKSSSKLNAIGNNAFYYCPALATVDYSEKQTALTNVGSSVFGLSPYMDAQTDEFVMLGNVLLEYNGTDTDITLDTDITAIADAFFGKDITSIDLGNVQYIGNNAFYGCKSLTNITLPATCTKIGDMAFAGCNSLKEVTYLGQLASIGFCSFANCSELVSFKNGASTGSVLTDIGECAFWNARKLFYLDTGEIENVNVGSFWNCFGETPDEVGGVYYYKLPKTVKTVAEGGFGNLWFAYVAIPGDLEAVASTAFGSTSGARYIVHKGTNIEEYFANSSYSWLNYGDMNLDAKINAKDIVAVAGYIAKDISAICANGATEAEKDVLNYEVGKGVIADIDGDGNITTKDLYEIFNSIKAEYEAESAE